MACAALKTLNVPMLEHMQLVQSFFDAVANALNALDGKVQLEVLCGGLLQELGKMQIGADRSRPAEFPRKFTRAWLSNVP